MGKWYALVNGQQYGPTDEVGMRQWVQDGRVGPDDLVWATGMDDWAPTRAVLFDGSGRLRSASMVTSTVPGGTGGRTPNGQITAQARAALRDKWGLGVGFCFLLWLLQMGVGMVPYIGGLIGMVLSGPFELGKTTFFLSVGRGRPADLNMMFVGFNNFGRALGLLILRGIFILGWLVCVAIPGVILGLLVGLVSGQMGVCVGVGALVGFIAGEIAAVVAALMYSQAFYLLADDKGLEITKALRQSRAMMVGYKGKLFCLGLRFFGWGLLCVLTLFIGFLWLAPYAGVSMGRFHDDLLPPAESDASAAPEAGASAPAAGLENS